MSSSTRTNGSKKSGKTARSRPPQPASHGAARLEDARARMYHDLIFDSAEFVFGDKGFEHATMQDVAREAGVSLKTLYATFPGKVELYDEIQRVRGKAFVERVLAASAAGSDPLDRLTRGVRAYVDFLFEHRAWLRIHLQTRMSWGLRPREGYAADYWQRGLDDLAANLIEGMKSGVFYADGDAHTMSALAQAVMQVEVSRAVERAEGDAARVAAEIMRQLQRLLCPRETLVDAEAPEA